MKKVKIGESHYLYDKQKINGRVHLILYFSKHDYWQEHVKGKIAYEIIDTGNGIQVPTKRTKGHVFDYDEIKYIQWLSKKIKNL